MSQASAIEFFALLLGRALEPLAERLETGNLGGLLADLGVQLPAPLLANGQLAAGVQATVAAVRAVVQQTDALAAAITADNTAGIAQNTFGLIQKIEPTLQAMGTMASALQQIANSGGLSAADRNMLQAFAQKFPEQLLGFLVNELMERHAPPLAGVLALTGIVDRGEVPAAAGTATGLSTYRRALRLDRIGKLLSDPQGLLRELYGFGETGFDGKVLFARIRELVDPPNYESLLLTPPGLPAVLESYLFRLAVDQTRSPPWLSAVLRVPALNDIPVELPLTDTWQVKGLAKARFDGGLALFVSPQGQIEIKPQVAPVTLDLALGVEAPRAASELVLLGQANKTRLSVGKLSLRITSKATIASGATPLAVSYGLAADLDGGKLVIDMSEGDSFLRTISGGLKTEGNFSLGATWSPQTGLAFTGSAAMEIVIPSHTAIGPITVDTLYLVAGIKPGPEIPIELSAAITGNLGPLTATVERFGAILSFTFPPQGGNLGPANFAVRFKPPSGVGLAIDAGVVRGGGYLFIDAERGEYAGALELTFAEFLSLKAIGIITTKKPDGSDGFSLLVIITAEFGTGLQLGFGFTLLGVGGLLGLNRTVRLDALIAGVRNGSVSNIMFPRDIIANAPRIISDLRTIFPQREGTFLIGPMAKLGWGTPTLVSISLGVIIEIPGNIGILGVLKVALPTEDAPLIQLQVSFAGAIEFDKKRLYFFATLFDSRVLFITLDGDMGLLAAFGDDANFVLSVGGFHPRFQPPPLPFPVPTRISVSILNESWARVRAEGYFAVTSNTAQFGSRVEIYFGFEVLSVESTTAFDALFQFSPFSFIVEIGSHFSVKVFGVGVWGLSIQLMLAGPAPWHAKGRASISLLLFDIPVEFDETWGEQRGTVLPDVVVLPLLRDEFAKKENWRAFLPEGKTELVSLRTVGASEDALVLHPVGKLRVLQKLVPLDLTISKLGNRKITDGKKFKVSVLPGAVGKTGDVSERFAAAQFNDLKDNDKLQAPAFEEHAGGLDLSPAGQASFTATAVRRANRYELITIDTAGARKRRRFHNLHALLGVRLLKGSAAAQASISMQVQKQKVPFADKVVSTGEGFAVALSDTNKAMAGTQVFASEAGAREYMTAQLAANPAMAGLLHVIPAFELAA